MWNFAGLQLAGLLGAAVKAGEQLDVLASGATSDLEAQLLAAQQNLADVAGKPASTAS